MEDPKSVNLKVYNRDMDSPDSSGYVRKITVILVVNLIGITTFYCYPLLPAKITKYSVRADKECIFTPSKGGLVLVYNGIKFKRK